MDDERPSMERAMSTNVVLDVVLSHLKVVDLLDCREVSKLWNNSASSVLRKRSTMIKTIETREELIELEECMKESSDFPFAGFNFDQPWMLKSRLAKKFFENYGGKFTSLLLDTPIETRIQDVAPFINHLPRLSILEIVWPGSLPKHPELLNSGAGQEGGRIHKLPSLRTLRIACETNEDVLRQVFRAASPSVRIECLYAEYEVLRQLKSAGKLQAVSFMDVYGEDEGEDYALRVADLLSTESPVLTKLYFRNDTLLSLDGLNKILTSSQHTLKDLYLVGTYPSQFSPECPVLTKLTTLKLHITEERQRVFQGWQGHKFPALKELELDHGFDDYDPSVAYLSDGLFIVPSLKKINLQNYVNKAGIEQLARSFPNVTEIHLKHKMYDFGYLANSNPCEIWSVGAFECLEKLKIQDCNVKWPTQDYDNLEDRMDLRKFKVMNMDSFLTGIPISICENLRKQNQKILVDSPLHEIFRDSPNILQLKNLKELIISVDFENKWKELPEEPPFISMVSLWYALEMIPNLRATFVYEPWSWDIAEEERDKKVTVLKTAFQHVQPYVELQPFFY